MHDYAISNIVYVKITGIYRKLYYIKQGQYMITKVFINGTFRVEGKMVNERINIRRLSLTS